MAYRVPQSNYVLKLCEICMIGLFPNYAFVEKIRRGGGGWEQYRMAVVNP